MSVQTQLTLKDYLRAQRAHAGLGYYFLRVLGATMLLAGTWHLWIGIRATVEVRTILGAGMIVLGMVWISTLPRMLRKQFKNNKKLTVPIHVTTSSEGIEMASEYGSSVTRWNAFVQFIETGELFLLYPQAGVFHVFPKHCFSPEQLAEFSRLVYANVPPKKRETGKLIMMVVMWIATLIAALVIYDRVSGILSH